MLEQYKEMDVQVDLSGTDIELPNDLTVGQELQEANVTMNVKMAGMNMKTIVNMMNRKVEKKETITTPAGSFECFVIYSENESQIMGMKKTFPFLVYFNSLLPNMALFNCIGACKSICIRFPFPITLN